MPRIQLLCASIVFASAYVAMSHTLIFLSLPPETSVVPCSARQRTRCVCPLSVPRFLNVFRSHTMIVLSSDAEMSERPSMSSAQTAAVCPRRQLYSGLEPEGRLM